MKLWLRRCAWIGVASALVLTLSGCGENGSRDDAQLLPPGLGADLARQSENVATTLGNGNGCAARAQMRQLRQDIDQAIADGLVPPKLESELVRRSTRLARSITCIQPPPPPPPPPVQSDDGDDDGDYAARGKEGDRGKKKGHRKEDD